MSDCFGRKPVLVISLTGLSIFTILFGISRSLLQMIVFRCLAGSFAGSVLTVRIMVSESCSKATEGRAFAWFMFARNMGILLGPIVGAFPTDHTPSRNVLIIQVDQWRPLSSLEVSMLSKATPTFQRHSQRGFSVSSAPFWSSCSPRRYVIMGVDSCI